MGTTVKIVIGLIAGILMLGAIAIALCTDLFSPETRPTLLQRQRVRRGGVRDAGVSRRAEVRSLMEARI